MDLDQQEYNDKIKIPYWEKSNLTVHEAADYSGIGVKKLYDIIKTEHSFVIYIGAKYLIRKNKFDEWMDSITGLNID